MEYTVLAAAGLVIGLAAFAGPASAAPAGCDSLISIPAAPSARTRRLEASDLLRLRDIGPVGAGRATMRILAVSPDRSRVAFQLQQADPIQNSYCIGMVVVDLKTGRPTFVDQGGEYIKAKTEFAGFARMDAGFAEVVTPKWSPDGLWIAYLRRDQGISQVWRARSDGRGAEQLTFAPADVDDFAWGQGGKTIEYAVASGIADQMLAVSKEARTGYLFDDRFDPERSSRPLPRKPFMSTTFAIDLATREITAIPDGSDYGTVPGLDSSNAGLKGPNGASARLVLDGQDAKTIEITTSEGITRCAPEICGGVLNAWWADDGTELWFLKRESIKPRLGLYRWQFRKSQPQPLLKTEDALIGCEHGIDQLICAQEGAKQPRRIVQIDLKAGGMKTLFDPNPEFAGLNLGSVERLRWKNDLGFETVGDLVLPPNYRPGTQLPLILVGYDTRGFLRGGTGDEYPIQLFAANGFAVLSYQRPIPYGQVHGAKTGADIDKLGRVDWADFRSVLSSLEIGVKILVDRGIADPSRVGLTGFSNGASVAQFAMVNSDTFKVFALSTCCEEESATAYLTGPAATNEIHAAGYPTLGQSNLAFWSPMSLRANAAKRKYPILLQLSDDEYVGALESYTALRKAGQPVEMYVFPDEHHVKWQPAHRAAIYQRSLDWFSFWLNGVQDESGGKVEQYQRWKDLRGAE